jgi:hypothetical protein
LVLTWTKAGSLLTVLAGIFAFAGCTVAAPPTLDASTWRTALKEITDVCGFTSVTKIQVDAGQVSALGPDGATTCNYYLAQKKAEIGTTAGTSLSYDAPSVSIPISTIRDLDPIIFSAALNGVGEAPLSWAVVQYQEWNRPYVLSDSSGDGRAMTLDGSVLPQRTVDSADLSAQWAAACAALTRAGARAQYVSASIAPDSSAIEFYGLTRTATIGFSADENGTPLHQELDPDSDTGDSTFGLSAVRPAQVWQAVAQAKAAVGDSATLTSFTLRKAAGSLELELVLNNDLDVVVANCELESKRCRVFD